jgi:heat shock protein HtpX
MVPERVFDGAPGPRLPKPSLLRSHPPTQERIRRLMSLYTTRDMPRFGETEAFGRDGQTATIPPRPRWRITGLWY